MKRSSDFDQMTIPPWLGFSSNPEGTKVHRCVKELKRKGSGNPYAICQSSTNQSYKTGKDLG
jgi:hypothetical protein